MLTLRQIHCGKIRWMWALFGVLILSSKWPKNVLYVTLKFTLFNEIVLKTASLIKYRPLKVFTCFINDKNCCENIRYTERCFLAQLAPPQSPSSAVAPLCGGGGCQDRGPHDKTTHAEYWACQLTQGYHLYTVHCRACWSH
jgi:hypothetical protein